MEHSSTPGAAVAKRPLAGVKVMDASESIAGQYCTRLMADAGADVYLVEPPRGSRTRWMGPFWTNGTRLDDSVLFWNLNCSKKSITLDLSQKTGQRLFERILTGSQIAVVSRSTAGAQAAAEAAGAPWFCWVDEFERTSAYGYWTGSEMVHQALSGIMYENGAADERPLYGCGHRAYYAAGTTAYIVSLAVLYAGGTGKASRSGRVNVSEVAPSMNHCRGTQYWYNGTFDERGEKRSPPMTLHCADRWVVAIASPNRWAATCRALGVPELATDPRFSDPLKRVEQWLDISEIFQRSIADVTCDDLIVRARQENAIVIPVDGPLELWRDPHLRARSFWKTVDDGEVARPALGGVFNVLGDEPIARKRPPRLAEDAASVFSSIGVTEDEYSYLRNIGVV